MIDLTMIELLRLHTGQDSEHIEDISSPHCHDSCVVGGQGLKS